MRFNLSKPSFYRKYAEMLRWMMLILFAFGTLGTSPARADKLDDDLQTTWEALWDQSGSPVYLLRWNSAKTVTYQIFGPAAEQHRGHIFKALTSASELTGLQFEELAASSSISSTATSTSAMLDIEVVNDAQMQDTMPCWMRPVRWSGFMFDKVQLKLRSKDAWRCTFHEMMHAMGLAGHPSGRTVLSYFSYRTDTFMDIDRLMLRGVYSPLMPVGATPLEAIKVFSTLVAEQPELGLPSGQAQQRANAFVAKTYAEMAAFAKGQGEVPVIIRRSGRASEASLANSRRQMAHYLGLVALRGTGADKDDTLAASWFKISALAGHSPAQVLLARSLSKGLGQQVNKPLAYAWYKKAAEAGNSVAKTELEALEATLTAEELDLAKAATTQ
jgi:Sel1 repeat